MQPFDLWRAQFALAGLAVEANAVIWMRVMGAGGAWNTPFDEGWRMLREKPDAFVASAARGVEALARGAQPADVLIAALEPLSHDAACNRARLEARGRAAPRARRARPVPEMPGLSPEGPHPDPR